MCRTQALEGGKNLKFVVWDTKKWQRLGFIVGYLARIQRSISKALVLRIKDPGSTICYSASEFWMDSFPAFILKLRFPAIRWVAAWYQTAPNPLRGYSEGERRESYRPSAMLYWLAQLPVRPFISAFADFVLVNNDEEKNKFPRLDKKGKAIVVLGAVDVGRVEKWRSKNANSRKIYDSVFQGRFHPQKGVVELIDIWKKVVGLVPRARLAMIGDGPLMENVKSQISRQRLQKNIKLFGYMYDGPEKYLVFSQSKLVVHPAFYDSGGMAAAEAMAFGIPAVGFDLKSFKSYYPRGMEKVEIGNLEAFAHKIVELLGDSALRDKLGKEAGQIIGESWSWDTRAQEVLNKITS